MAEFDINLQGVRQTRREQEEVRSQIDRIRKSLNRLSNSLQISGSSARSVRKAINQISSLLSGLSGDARELEDVLSQITDIYERVEADIVGSAKNKTAMQKALSQLTNIYHDIRDFFSGVRRDFYEYAGDPVNVCTGNYIAEVEEFSLEGRHPIELKRYYNSVSDHIGALGSGWSHTFETALEQRDDRLEILWGDGHKDVYEQQEEAGSYVNAYGGSDYITREGEGFCHVSEEEKLWFSASGQMERSEDLQGNAIFFSYEEDHLRKVENESGLALTFDYNDEGYLVQVTDSVGRQVDYRYTGGTLVEAASADDAKIRYTYDENKRLTATVNPREITVMENEYDDEGRILLQKLPGDTEMQYQYHDEENRIDFTERNGSVIRYIHDEKFRHVATAYADGT